MLLCFVGRAVGICWVAFVGGLLSAGGWVIRGWLGIYFLDYVILCEFVAL